MKLLLIPVFAIAVASFAAPVAAACPWSHDSQTTEKPKDTAENPST